MVFKIIDSLYLLFIGICIGAMVACGAFSAPVIFGAGNIVEDLSITPAQSGLLMGTIFQKLNALLLVCCVAILVFELFAARLFRTSGVIVMLSAGVSIIMILLFSLYYTPYILTAPDSSTPEFESMHFQSVVIFKILMASLIVLFVAKCLKLFRHS